MNDLYLGAYWGPRSDDIDTCSEMLCQLLINLSSYDQRMSSWLVRGSKSSAKRPLITGNTSVAAIRDMLLNGRNKRDLDGSIIDDLGFRASLWNGLQASDAIGLSVLCGSHCIDPRISNSVVIDLPEDLGVLAGKYACAQLLSCVASLWEPEWAGVISRAARNSRDFDAALPFVDWIIYINRTGVNASRLPQASEKSEVSGKGTIIIVQDNPINYSEAPDLSNVKAVTAVVHDAL